MGNNLPSTNFFHRNNSSPNIGKFWKKRSKSEHFSNKNELSATALKSQSKSNRRSSLLNQQQTAKKQSAIFRLRKSKSEKVNEVFGSSDMPLLNDNDCGGSMEMENSSGKNLINHEISRFVPSTNYKGMIDRPPINFNSSASTISRFMNHQQENATEYGNGNQRRVKSFRHFPAGRQVASKNRSLFNGPISGLTMVQKRLILNIWRHFDRANLFEICFSIFERFFQRHPQFALLHFCNYDDKQIDGIPLEMLWKSILGKHRLFHIHVERFSTILYFALVGLEEENLTLEQLPMEYGASLAGNTINNPIPSQYWELLRQCLIDQNSSEKQMLILQNNPLIDSLDRPFARVGSKRSHEAWQAFATYFISKIRFGYETERFLRKRFNQMIFNFNEINGVALII